jgi:hypothetical protein
MVLTKRRRSGPDRTVYTYDGPATDAPPSPSDLGGSVDAMQSLTVHADRVEMRYSWCHTSGHAQMSVDGDLEVFARTDGRWPADLLPTLTARFGREIAREVDHLLKDPTAFA